MFSCNVPAGDLYFPNFIFASILSGFYNGNSADNTHRLHHQQVVIAAGVCVMIGEIIAFGSFPSFLTLLLGFVWGFFLSSPAMIINDYFDIEVDMVNSPHRPLPSGLILPTTAITLAIITSLIGLAASVFIHKTAVLLYIVFWLIGFLYNWKLKEMGLLGNLLVCSSVAVTFILGGIAVGTME